MKLEIDSNESVYLIYYTGGNLKIVKIDPISHVVENILSEFMTS